VVGSSAVKATRDTDSDAEYRRRLNQRLRAGWLESAEKESRQRLGRGLTRDKFERALKRYPGDV
jgi:hypothetical protein